MARAVMRYDDKSRDLILAFNDIHPDYFQIPLADLAPHVREAIAKALVANR